MCYLIVSYFGNFILSVLFIFQLGLGPSALACSGTFDVSLDLDFVY